MKAVTLIVTYSPESVGKVYTLTAEGKLQKKATANVYEGRAQTLPVPDAATMAKLLEHVTSRTDLVIVNGVFRGAGDGEINIRTASRFKELVEADGANYAEVLKAGTVYTMKNGPKKGQKYAARLKDLQDASGWVLLDADEPEGFPDEWWPLSFQQRLELLELYAPGISTAERVELRGSSARVVKDGAKPTAPSHGWIAVEDPEDLARAAVALGMHATAGGTFFPSPRRSRETGEIIGYQPRTAIDLAPWHRGRLNFDSCPTIKAKGYTLADAGITIVNAGGGSFRARGVAMVSAGVTSAYRDKTGLAVRITGDGSAAMATIYGQLTMDTPIEVRGEEKPLRDWATHMEQNNIEKLRCEAPFRASDSEAAFIGFERNGEPFVYDIGVSTKFSLPPQDNALSCFDEFEDLTADAAEASMEPEAEEEDEAEGAVADATGEAGDGEAKPATDDDPDIPLSIADVKAADISTPEGVAIVDRYRLQELNRLNTEIGYLVVEGKGVIVRIEPDATNALGAQFISIDAERLFHSNVSVPFVTGAREPVLKWSKIFPVWLDWSGRRAYRGMTFNPRSNVRAVRRLPKASRGGKKAFDLFTGMAWDPAPGDCKPILAHLREVICGGQMESTTYVLNWLARLVQKPHLPAETALVIRGGQGIGKNTLFDIMTGYFGGHGIELTKEQDLVGFNDHLATSIFVSLNEAVWGGNKASEGIIKSLITDPFINVERKYLPKFRVPNRTHLVVMSNNDWAVPVGHDDRRYVVLNPSAHRVGQVAYFEALRACINNGGKEAFIQYLLDRDISAFNPRVLPKVVGVIKLEQKMRTANSVVSWLHGVLDDGGIEVEEEGAMVRRKVWVDITQTPVTKAALYASYVASVRPGRPEHPAQFGVKLREILGEPLVSSSRLRSGFRPATYGPQAQTPCYTFGALAKLRAAFDTYMGESIPWSA